MSRGKVDIYTIPPNFAEEGTILSGRVRTRNAVETVLLVLFLFQGLMMLPAGNRTKIYVGVIVLLPAAIFLFWEYKAKACPHLSFISSVI